jgi:hypothetical protein
MNDSSTNWTHGQIIAFLIIAILFVIFSTIDLNTQPPPWWDEGWTVNIARNWVMLDHYGHLTEGQPSAPGLNAALPVVAPVALSFKILGIGIWQARLPSVIYLLGSLGLIFILAQRLFNRDIAIGSLYVLLFLSGPAIFHPLTLGRMVMGDFPMLFFLLAGCAAFGLVLNKSGWFILLCSLLWGIAIAAKAQTLPFWLVSLAVPLVLCGLKHWWRPAMLILAGIILSWLVSSGFEELERIIVSDEYLRKALPGIVETLAVVLVPTIRFVAIRVVFVFALPVLLGIVYSLFDSIRSYSQVDRTSYREITKWMLLSFVVSWLGWYAFLSIGFNRYLFPVIFVGSIFTSALFSKLTFDFNFKHTIQHAALFFRRDRGRANWGAMLALCLVAIYGSLSVLYINHLFTQPKTPLQEVVDYLEQISKPGQLIESYESELFFLMERPYHYPPDITNIQFIRRNIYHEDVDFSYDPLAADPDYLVWGYFGELSQVYDRVLESGEFKEIKAFVGYKIFERVRE